MNGNKNLLLYIDCFSGVSGDMLLASLFDLGLSFEDWRREMNKLALGKPPVYELSDAVSGSVTAKRFVVREEKDSQPARTLKDTETLMEKSALDEDIKKKSLKAFRRLAECEGRIHGRKPDEVHFHELSGVDTIVDVVGCFTAIKMLGVSEVVSSPVNVGSGIVECDHGVFPVPAPATAKLLEGKPVFSRFDGELTTPTGALLLTELASGFGGMPLMRLIRTGCGTGTRDYGRPNCLRLFLGERIEDGLASGRDEGGNALLLSTNIDDMEPRLLAHLMERLLEGGALDVYFEPVYMKKNRPGTVVNVLCESDSADSLIDIIMREATTLGIRMQRVSRVCMERRIEMIDTPYGPVRIKIGLWKGEALRVNPEYEDCARAALKTGLPLARILEEVTAIAMSRFPKSKL